MERLIVLQEDQLRDIVYEAVSRCLEEKQQEQKVMKPQPQDFMDSDDVCEYLHISDTTLWRLRKEGLITCRKVGNKNLFDRGEIERQVAAGKLSKYSRKHV